MIVDFEGGTLAGIRYLEARLNWNVIPGSVYSEAATGTALIDLWMRRLRIIYKQEDVLTESQIKRKRWFRWCELVRIKLHMLITSAWVHCPHIDQIRVPKVKQSALTYVRHTINNHTHTSSYLHIQNNKLTLQYKHCSLPFACVRR